jgi:hypothetical protein
MLELTYEKRNVRPRSYTPTSKMSLAIRPELISAIIDLSKDVMLSINMNKRCKVARNGKFFTTSLLRRRDVNMYHFHVG